MPKSSFKRVVPTNQGWTQNLVMNTKLIFRLMGDKRVSPYLKIIPVGSLVYLFSPIDFLSFMPFDDLAVVGTGMYLFVELCPQYVVEEHLTNLRLNIPSPFHEAPQDEVVVDGEFTETKEPRS